MAAGTSFDLKSFIASVVEGNDQSFEETQKAFGCLMDGEASATQIGALLTALRMKGETVPEITGAAEAMRDRMVPISAPEGAIDVCGTGGDAKGTLNISSTVAFVATAAGATVAKHGNRAASSKSGAGDVLEALGINCAAEFDLVEKALRDNGTCFLFAQRHHPAMRHVGPSRAELGMRTIFNFLGPLSNPCRIKKQLMGVFDRNWVEPLAQVLKQLGHETAWVAHGAEGLDELSICGESLVTELKNGQLSSFSVVPEDAGLERAPLDAIRGGDGAHNARAMRALLAGEDTGAYRTSVLLNASAALIVAGIASDLKDGVARATEAIDSGEALKRLDGLVAISNGN
ncbi:anthranilate phosphoribosyltransferase [Kiloniella sp. b19]|uniref:anthranilate phosphoribosyltransferase n=1 Tax=Kiloniella sp. GXU_MW_B19 TaxID=3141326 RepID=UPI0031CE966C